MISNLGNVYIADTNNNRVRKVTLTTGIMSTIAGTSPGYSGDGGDATSATLWDPFGVAVDASGMKHHFIIAICSSRDVFCAVAAPIVDYRIYYCHFQSR